MSIVLEAIQYDEILQKLNEMIQKLDDISKKISPAQYPTYSVTLVGNSVGANRIHLVLFNSSDKKISIRRIIVSSEVTGTVTGFQIAFRVHRISAYSGGTALPIQKYDPDDPDPVNVTAVSNATSVTSIGILDNFVVNPEETSGQHTSERVYELGGMKPIVIKPNSGICIQQYGTAGTGTVTITIVFTIE